MEKKFEDSIKDRLIITSTTTEIFYVIKTANVKPLKASLDAMDIMRLVGGIVGGVLVKDYAVYKNGSMSNTSRNFMAPLRAIKLHNTIG